MVHAKAAGAWGHFEVTHDVSDLTSAKFLTSVGKRTEVLTRISTVAGEKGAPDTVRDVRGWALKFFTEEGNQDFVFNDLPVFFVRDPIKFPSMNPKPKGGSLKYVKWHLKPTGGIETLPPDVAMRLAGEEPNYHIKDLFRAIEKGDYPTWTLYVQVIDPKDASNAGIPIFDDTYTWPHERFPLRPIGQLT
ncbi:MAG: hypothetical protein Q9162_000988 [Coniocarpon cinnabarinum]